MIIFRKNWIYWILFLLSYYLLFVQGDTKGSKDKEDARIKEVRTLRNKAMQSKDKKNYDVAAMYLEKSLKQLKEVIEPTLINSSDKKNNRKNQVSNLSLYSQILTDYGTILYHGKKFKEAVPVLEEAIKMSSKIFGKSHPSYSLSIRSLAEVYSALHKYKKAIKLYKSLSGHIEKGLGKRHEAYIETCLKIGELYNLINKFDKTIKLFQSVFDEFQDGTLNEKGPGINKIYIQYSIALAKSKKDYKKALEFSKKANQITEEVSGKNSMDYAFSLNNIAGVLASDNDYEEALVYLKKAHSIAFKILGKDHPNVLESKRYIKIIKERIKNKDLLNKNKMDEL